MTVPPKVPNYGPLTAKGEAVIKSVFETVTLALAPNSRVTYNKEQDNLAGYVNNHPLIEEKVIPASLVALRLELNEPRHAALCAEAMKGKSFEECLGILAARLDIAVDGAYEVSDLAEVLYLALINRKPGAVQNHHLRDSRLVNAELKETATRLSLEEVAEQHEIKGVREATSGEGPYTICRGCTTSFECCQARSCKLGRPAQQLGNSISVLKKLKGKLQ